MKATTDGNIFPPNVEPSAEGIITGLPPSKYAASEFVVPRSMPIITSFAIFYSPLFCFSSSLFSSFLETTTFAGRSSSPSIRYPA